MRAAANPAPQLMELGEPEALGVFHNHEAGVWHVNPDFDDGSRDQHPDMSRGEFIHNAVLFGRLHAAVKGSDRMGRTDLGEPLCVGDDIGQPAAPAVLFLVFNDGADDKDLPALAELSEDKVVNSAAHVLLNDKGVNFLASLWHFI
ncbi:hypothetical protein SDC9_164677 [bioreactor metagenome]|uniref:Uncharacterized protein n=1 Tax=bioreactor metagenome TaxID=1076179 RepID=A0A645FZN1_9ZZZZ